MARMDNENSELKSIKFYLKIDLVSHSAYVEGLGKHSRDVSSNTILVIGNEVGDLSSNPEWSCLHFT